MLRPSLIAFLSLGFGTIAGSAQVSPDLPGRAISHSPSSTAKYIGSPGLARLADGTLIASHDEFGGGSSMNSSGVTRLFRSTDQGRSWTPAAVINGAFWSTLFTHRDHLYLLGTDREYGNIVIRRSADGGFTWTQPSGSSSGLLTTNGQYHGAPVPVIEHQGRLWRAFERRDPATGWAPNFRAAMLSAPVDADLLLASSWTLSNLLPGQSAWLGNTFGGWLEGNAVVTPQGQLVNLLRVDHPNHPEKIARLTVSSDGRSLAFDPSSGFASMPGGSKKFTIRFDPVSQRYWTLSNLVPAAFQSGRHPASTRNTLSLLSSSDLQNWSDHGTVLSHPDPSRHGFQYVEWIFDGDDLLATARTAFDDSSGGAANYHDANFLTFHRLRDFRLFDRSPLPGPWRHAFSPDGGLEAEGDEDADGFTNRHEYLAGSNPLRPNSTPGRMGSSVRVAVAGASGLDLYQVSASHQWTFERRLTTSSYQSIVCHDGSLYGSGFHRIDRIDPESGNTVTLATRNAGTALGAGWTHADSQQIVVGPDGRLYFSTAFGTSSGQGVFRLSTDGSGFQQFIPRSGPSWDLNNARGFVFSGNRCWVSSRAGSSGTNRPVDEFDASGQWLRSLRSDLRAPQTLFLEDSRLRVCGFSGTLTTLDTSSGSLAGLISGNPSMIVMDAAEIHGEVCVITYQHGVWRHRERSSLTPVFTPQGVQHASLAVLPSPDGYAEWIASYPSVEETGELDDPDRDGVPNRLEFLLGWNPADGVSLFAATLGPSGPDLFRLSWPAAPGAVFTIRASDDLLDWSEIVAVVAGPSAGSRAFYEIPESGPRRFYRVEWTP